MTIQKKEKFLFSHHYYLDGHTPKKCKSMADILKTKDRRVSLTRVLTNQFLVGWRWPFIRRRVVEVSTVFLAIDHNFSGKGSPLLFETMIFGSTFFRNSNEYQIRYSTWDEAKAGHERAVKYAEDEG